MSCDSFDEFAEATDGWELDWRQLDRGSLRARLLQIVTPSLLVTQFRFSRKFHQRGTSPPGMRTFGIVGSHSSPVEWNGREGATNQIEVFPANDEYDCVSNPDFHGDGISIVEDRFSLTAETLGVPNPLERLHEGHCVVVAETSRMYSLRRGLAELLLATARPSGNPLGKAACSDLELEIHADLISALTPAPETDTRTPQPGLRSRSLRLALDYIEACADEAPTVSEICLESGASYRTLNYAFHERFGTSPKQYLQAVRLNGVRRDLNRMGPHSLIADIANEWGFWHMGRFSADYRKMFGELPSETIQAQTTRSDRESSRF